MITVDGLVKLLDFGLAKLASPVGSVDFVAITLDGRATTPGTILGTVGYMSPEQAKGQPADARSDQFSLGTLLYEAATGENPFRRPTPVQTLSAIIEAAAEPLSEAGVAVSDAFCRIVERCLAKEPERRYASTEDLRSELSGATEPPASAGIILAGRERRHTVGRDESVAELRKGLEWVRAGRGLLLCIAGETGIGKTTLVETFLDGLDPGRARIGRGRCSERLAGTEAYLPFLESLESLLRGDAADETARRMKKLAPSWFFELRPDSFDEGTQRASAPERMKRELSSFLEELSRQAPMVLFLEDLHWADVSTVDLLAHLADRFDALHVLVLATYRPEELRIGKHAFLKVRSDLQARGACREVTLPFLTLEDIEHYLSLEFPEHDFPDELPLLIHEKTEGSSLFMADVLRDLKDRDVITERNGVWHREQSVSEIGRELPQSVRGMIERKLEPLDEADRRLMVAASIRGDEFDSAVLSEVLEQDPAEVEERLEVLERVHALVRPVGEEEFPDGTFTVRYRFVHVLYQNTLFDSLTPTRRAKLSRAVAEALLSHLEGHEDSIASELGVLFEAARDRARGAQYFGIASRNASRVFAYREAIVVAHRGLQLVSAMPETPDRAGLELALQMAQAPALIATKGYAAPEVGEAFNQARQLYRDVGETPQLFPVMHGLYMFSLVRPDLPMSLELAEQLLQLAEREPETHLLIPAHRALGTSLTLLGRIRESHEHFERGSELYELDQHHTLVRLYGQDEGMLCRQYSSWTLWLLGYPDQAVRRSNETIEEVRRGKKDPYGLTQLLSAASCLHRMRRDPQATRETAEEALALATEHGFPLWVAWAAMHRGWALAQLGRYEEGIALVREGMEGWVATGAELHL